jgi:hypothetical protein
MDRVELLACLASDWCDGSVAEHWWWRSLFKDSNSRSAVLHAWLDAPEYAPAALEQLALRGAVVPFVRNLGSQDARRLLLLLTETFAMYELAAIVADIPDAVSPATASMYGSGAVLEPEPFLNSTAPWRRWSPEYSASGLSPLHQCLLGVGLMLARSPRAVRTAAFADAVGSWSRGEAGAGRISTPTMTADLRRSAPPEAAAPLAAEAEPISPAAAAMASATPPNAGTFSDGTLYQPPPQSTGTAAADSDERNMSEPVPVGERSHRAEEHGTEAGTPPDPEQMLPRYEGHVDAALPLDVSFNTELGGLFYLINLGIFLNLYGDFTRPLQPGITLDIWDFVTLIGRHLLGEAGEADPLWPLLARLSGRSDTEPLGSGFQPPDLWRLPAEWLLPFPESGNWKWSTTDQRLRVRHWDGFLLLDQPLVDGDHREQVRRATEAYSPVVPFRLERGATVRVHNCMSLLDRWLHRFVPYLQARLKRGLGVTEAEQISPLLCRNSARVSVSAARVDVFFALDEHPIEIRLAGLDRNPGWVPAAGRFIAFNYE